jgi:hypothetical protein
MTCIYFVVVTAEHSRATERREGRSMHPLDIHDAQDGLTTAAALVT